MINKQIAHYLQEQRDNAIASFQAEHEAHLRFRDCFAALQSYDFVTYSQLLRDEILQNLTYWCLPVTSGEPLQPLDALLFEFNSIYEWAVKANAYGIIDWKDAAPHIVGFDMGFHFDFRKKFEAVPGVSLSFLQPLEDLLDPETIDDLAKPEQDLDDIPNFRHLADAYLFSGLVSIHNVLVELMQQNVFSKINLKPAAQFLLGGHDTGIVFPLLSMPSH